MAIVTINVMGGDPQFSKTETAILRYLVSNITKEFSIMAISDSIRTAYPTVHRNIKGLAEKGIVRIKVVNKTQSLCSIDITKPDNVGMIATIEFMERDIFLSDKPQIKAMLDDILSRIAGNSFSFLLFGSYARGETKPSSDIDLLFLVNTANDEKRTHIAVEGASRLTNRKIHPIVLTYPAFFSALKEKEQTLPKEILEKHIIIYGAEAFYRGLVMNA